MAESLVVLQAVNKPANVNANNEIFNVVFITSGFGLLSIIK